VLKQHALQNATLYTDTTKEEISQILQDGVDNGDSIDTISASLGQYFDDGSQWKAERLARTEVSDAYNQGNLEGFRQTDIPYKSWLTDGDSPDETCNGNEADGVIPTDQSFSSGDDAPPGHPNCECTLLPETSIDGS